jgi:hypothetical protein
VLPKLIGLAASSLDASAVTFPKQRWLEQLVDTDTPPFPVLSGDFKQMRWQLACNPYYSFVNQEFM